MGLLTLGLFFFAFGAEGKNRINRVEGLILVLIYIGYSSYLGAKVIGFL
jgi:cation:H+ antiporter